MSKANAKLIWVLIAIIVCVCSTAIGYEYGSHRYTSSATPQIVNGKFMGLGVGGNEIAFQPSGSSNGQSYSWDSSETWFSANGVEHVGGVVPCLTKSSVGKEISLAIITIEGTKQASGTVQIVWLQCHN